MDLFNTILIILSTLTVLFTLFLCIIAVVAFLGWQNLKDLKQKQKLFLIQQRKMITEAEGEIGLRLEGVKKLSSELENYKNKIKTTTDFKKYESKTEELINKLKNTIREAEEKINDLRISASTSEISSISGSPITGATYFFGVSNLTKVCSKCGKAYLNSQTLGTSYSRCPYCGNLNY